MMTIKKVYYYFFHKFYKFSEAAPSRWLSDWKAMFSLLVLEIWILLSVMVYYKVFTKKDLIPDNRLTMVSITVVIALSLIKYFAFEHRDRWKEYVEEFSKWPTKKNKTGTLVVWLIVLLIIANLIFSFYLMSQINWKQYR
jgi:uncharacterized membrane protein YwzB